MRKSDVGRGRPAEYDLINVLGEFIDFFGGRGRANSEEEAERPSGGNDGAWGYDLEGVDNGVE